MLILGELGFNTSNWEALGSNPSERNIIFSCPKIC